MCTHRRRQDSEMLAFIALLHQDEASGVKVQ